MLNNPLVSVLVNNYNYADYLRCAIDSVLSQEYENIELIVVDDGSQDNSRKILSDYGKKVHAIVKDNGGQASAFNAGFEASHGDIVCFLDADDTFFPTKISSIVNIFFMFQEAEWVFHELQYTDKKGNYLTEQIEEKGIDKLTFIDFRQDMKRLKRMPYFPATTGLSFRSSLLKNVLPMPEKFNISADSFLRLASLCQAPGVLCPQKFATHRQHGRNLYVHHPEMLFSAAETGVYVAYYLYARFPDFHSFTNRIFFRSIGRLIGLKGIRYVLNFYETRQYLKSFFLENNIKEWLSSFLCMFLNCYRSLSNRHN